MRDVTLPSGAVLKVTAAPFSASKALYQAVLRELRRVEIHADTDMASVYKDLFCLGFSSPEIDRCMSECLKRCTYDELKIDDQTFEPESRRPDYMQVIIEVAKENVLPFGKSLYAEYQRVLAGTAVKPPA